MYERMLLAALPRYGVSLVLGLPPARGPKEVVPGWEIRRVWPARGLRWYVAPAAFVPFTLGLLRRDSVDLLRGHSVRFTGPSLFAARALDRSRVPIVLHHLHTDPGWEPLEGALLRRADGVVTISEHSRRQLETLGVDAERTFVAHPGVERPARLRAVHVGEAWPQVSGIRLLYVGRLVARKQPHVVVETLGALARSGTDAILCVAGEGQLRNELQALASAHGLQDRVRWLGAVDEDTKWALYEAADVLLFPSVLEGFGFVVAEAQLSGLPAVVAAGTASSEIVVAGESGEVVERSAAQFAAAVERLSHRLGRAPAARRAASRFTWAASAERVADAYRRVLERTVRP
jgi:glycosyltransferase involved in cell wall biosynthesis